MMETVITALGRVVRRPMVLICALVLASSAVGIHVGAKRLKWHFRKEAVPLRRSLDDLDEHRLFPYVAFNKQKIANPDVEKELGTEDYIQWMLEDKSVDRSDPARYVQLFITYYTGNPDKVPHVPDWCYVGSGGVVSKSQNRTITVPGIGLAQEEDALPVRMLTILLPGSGIGQREQRTVTYFFAVNGTYRCTRNQVRLLQNNFRDKYTYFSKVEVFFPGSKNMSEEKTLQAVEKICRVVVPVLYERYWPDWQVLTAQGQEASGPARSDLSSSEENPSRQK